MRTLALALLLSGCAGDWGSYAYGPGDYAREQWGWPISSPYTAAADIVEISAMSEPGFAIRFEGRCVIAVQDKSRLDVVSHELNHCNGVRHD